uniref:Uncharacterized protein n=1 Tax=Onchocerca volvulus TaxID=6282 RepID=A0A2K6VDQ4_ONCVO
MLNATKFYQNCVDKDTESRWMEVYEEQKSGQTTSSGLTGNGQEDEMNVPKLSTRSTIEMGNPKMKNTNVFLEKTHSAETKVDRNFKACLQRCHEMENIDQVAHHE